MENKKIERERRERGYTLTIGFHNPKFIANIYLCI